MSYVKQELYGKITVKLHVTLKLQLHVKCHPTLPCAANVGLRTTYNFMYLSSILGFSPLSLFEPLKLLLNKLPENMKLLD